MSHNLTNREFLGQGLAFPLQINPRGEIALVAGVTDIEQSIRIILGTSPGERVMRPEFGCRIHELIFAPQNAATEGLVAHYVEEALERWEPRIDIRSVEATADPNHDGALLIEVHYQVKDTYDERSIIYPFYLMGEEEAPI